MDFFFPRLLYEFFIRCKTARVHWEPFTAIFVNLMSGGAESQSYTAVQAVARLNGVAQ